MFSETVSDSWESSEFQNAFIKDYFGEKLSPSMKDTSRSRKRQSLPSETSNSPVRSNKPPNPKQFKSQDDVFGEKKPSNKGKKESGSSKKEKISNKSKKFLKNSSLLDSSALKKSNDTNPKRGKNISTVEESDECLSGSSEIEYTSQSERTDSVSCTLHQKRKLFQSKPYQKLQAAKFRYLNELLYTNTGKFSLDYFQQNADDFEDYHTGYQSQVAKWPLNPVDVIIKDLQKKKKLSVVADLGCGEAKIATALSNRTVHSFDLIAMNDNVTACDMAHVPLPGESVDAVVFCLSLMGTNWKEYLLEGHRILKLGGFLKIAEIESRIEDKEKFVKSIEQCGFDLVSENTSHKMFFFFTFKKIKQTVKASKVKMMTLKPCLYKKR